VAQYEPHPQSYEASGLPVQAVARRRKADKARECLGAAAPVAGAPVQGEPMFSRPLPQSPLFEVLNEEERAALVKEMELEQHREGDIIITEGEPGSSMYVISTGEVKVYTRGQKGSVYLAKLGEGDFFGEVSMLTGKPRTATITASQPT